MTEIPLTEAASGPLAGLRVLAGPYATMLLGDLGADVIKVEGPAGDDTRDWGPPFAGDPADRMSAYFLSVNRSKRGITLNLKTPGGRRLARELAQRSHVLVENFKPGGMARFGLGYDDLRGETPALVYASITGFGQNGPYHDRPGYDHVIQAMSGLMAITGPRDGPPHKVGVAIVDVITGLLAAASILAALRHAERTGQGQHLDLSLLDSSLSALVNIASNALISGVEPARYGNDHPNIVPYQVFAAADGDFVLAVGNDAQFAALCRVIDQPGLAADPRFATNPARVNHRAALVAVLSEHFARGPVAAWIDALLTAGIPAGPIHSVTGILNDPHVLARGLIGRGTLATGADWPYVGPPVGFSQTPPQVRLPPPRLGEHTEAVLRAVLGLDEAAIAAHRDAGDL